MDRLKSVLADKIIEVASENNDSSKARLEKLNRFRDFSYACDALIKKYPRIEDELIRMIESNDFDTRIASSRVNNIISFTDDENMLHAANRAAKPAEDDDEVLIPEEVLPDEIIEVAAEEVPQEDEVPVDLKPVLASDDIWQVKDNEIPKEIPASFSEEVPVQDDVKMIEESPLSEPLSSEKPESSYASSDNVQFDYSEANKTKTNVKRILTVLAVVAGVVLLWVLILFVMKNWKTILIVLGIVAAVGGLIWLLASKKNNNE